MRGRTAVAATLDIDLLADHEARTSLKQKTSKGKVRIRSSLAARLLTCSAIARTCHNVCVMFCRLPRSQP